MAADRARASTIAIADTAADHPALAARRRFRFRFTIIP